MSVDQSGNTIQMNDYKIRYLSPDGIIITKEQYDICKQNNIMVYKAAFVGCTLSLWLKYLINYYHN
jgi:hypothetical protein